MEFQWYPGHMTKARRMMQEDMKLIDVVLELIDARVPRSSKNPDIDNLAGGKARILLLNKYDLADPERTKEWKSWYETRGFFVHLVNSKSGAGVKEVEAVIATACREKTERDRRRGIKNRPIRAMVVGIPNVGKSTFINSLTGKACTKTGNKPGVTKGKQWIRLNKNVDLLDTPGILWPKFEDPVVGMRLAFIGSIREERFSVRELALEFIRFLERSYASVLPERYDIGADVPWEEVLTRIAFKRGCLLPGQNPDLDKAARILMEEFRNGRLGRLTLENAEEQEAEARGNV